MISQSGADSNATAVEKREVSLYPTGFSATVSIRYIILAEALFYLNLPQ